MSSGFIVKTHSMTDQNRSDLLIHVAMRAEAMPIVERLDLKPVGQLDPHLPSQLWRGLVYGHRITLVINGCDPEFDCDRIGTESATIVVFLALRLTLPKLLINAGTCGGFALQGSAIGDMYMPTRFLFHDQRVALPKFDAFAKGDQQTADFPLIRSAINAKHGTCSTGSSLDTTAQEMAFFEAESVTCKDMEAAAILRVARDLETPFIALKAVTDLVDHRQTAQESFLKNLKFASTRLAVAVDDAARVFSAI